MSKTMRITAVGFLVAAALTTAAFANEQSIGLPDVPIPADNPQTAEKIALGDRLFHDARFSSTGDVSCATCHDALNAFTDSPKKTSEGVDGQTGTRNAPTVLNSAFNKTQFWDGRSPSLEDQALHPFTNPIEMGLKDHQQILDIISKDRAYKKAFKKVFGVKGTAVTMDHVTKAIAAFERTAVAGNSPFDQWFYGGNTEALSDRQKQGYELYIGKARCVSCHVIEQQTATFTDHQFHNIGVGVNTIQEDIPSITNAYFEADKTMEEVDIEVLTDPKISEIGRFAVTTRLDDIGSFKTPTLRNIELTAPYMHDGSIATLEKVVEHYNNGGVTNEGDPVNDFLAGGIRPLNLSPEEQEAVVDFLKALTSTELSASSK